MNDNKCSIRPTSPLSFAHYVSAASWCSSHKKVFLILPFQHQQGQVSNGNLMTRYIFLHVGPLNIFYFSVSLRICPSNCELERKGKELSKRCLSAQRFNSPTSSTHLPSSSSGWSWPFSAKNFLTAVNKVL